MGAGRAGRYVAIMMARTQVTLDPELHRRARERAAELGVSAVFDLGDSRSAGLAPIEDRDRAVGEAIEAEAREEGWLGEMDGPRTRT